LRLRFTLLSALCALILTTAASATSFGVADDYGKYAADSGTAFYTALRAANLTDDRITVVQAPGEIAPSVNETAFLDRSLPVARDRGVNVVLAIYPARLADYNAATFCPFAVGVAKRYPWIKEIILGNEPNKGADAAAYVQLLAACYDQLKPLGVTVIGGALSPRKTTAASFSPVLYIAELGKAYKALGRSTPVMDAFDFHPYPNPDRIQQGVQAGYDWPNAGMPDLPRLYQAFEDAFGGSGQPTFRSSLRMRLNEAGWQAAVPAQFGSHYVGTENNPTVDEPTQARFYRDLIGYVSCDPLVVQLLLFHLVDEKELGAEAGGGGWQSGMMRADLSKRDSYAAVASAVGSGCVGGQRSWSPASGVVGGAGRSATVVRGKQKFSQVLFSAEEGVSWTLAITKKVKKGKKTTTSTLLSKSGSTDTTARDVLAGQAVPKEVGGATYTLTLTAVASPSRVTKLTGTVAR
jgi:hypothetical protein